jgi:outer membrane protein OmpA-like peptidoglycan-associated protein
VLFFLLFGCQKPLLVSHLSSDNLAITRRKGASKHYFLSKAICFDVYCRGTVGWKRKQKKRRFKGYKNPNRPQSRPIKEPVIAEHAIPVSNIDSVQTHEYQQIEFGMPTIFNRATFQVNSFQLQNEFLQELDGFADFLLHNPDIRVTIIGHTDDVGTPETNQELSENRAMEVQNYLILKGVDQFRLSSFGKGDSGPIIKGSTESDRAINRRVEFELSK